MLHGVPAFLLGHREHSVCMGDVLLLRSLTITLFSGHGVLAPVATRCWQAFLLMLTAQLASHDWAGYFCRRFHSLAASACAMFLERSTPDVRLTEHVH